jgi:hypothetical protein
MLHVHPRWLRTAESVHKRPSPGQTTMEVLWQICPQQTQVLHVPPHVPQLAIRMHTGSRTCMCSAMLAKQWVKIYVAPHFIAAAADDADIACHIKFKF